MTFESTKNHRSFLVGVGPAESIAEQRARVALEKAERDEQRQAELLELSSIRHTPGERIRLWERLHGLALPRDPNHHLLDMIAAATQLELPQVRERFGETTYEVTVRLDDGAMRVVQRSDGTRYAVGDRVRVTGSSGLDLVMN